MSKYLFWQWQIQSHQENWPINCMETNDIFTNQMQICWPVFLELFCAFAIAIISDTCDIVCQRIQPYVSNMFWVKINWNTPFERSTGYTQILQTWKQEVVHHLVLTGYWLNKFWVSIDMVNQSLCIFAHFEEICFFFCWCTWTSAVWTFSIN